MWPDSNTTVIVIVRLRTVCFFRAARITGLGGGKCVDEVDFTGCLETKRGDHVYGLSKQTFPIHISEMSITSFFRFKLFKCEYGFQNGSLNIIELE